MSKGASADNAPAQTPVAPAEPKPVVATFAEWSESMTLRPKTFSTGSRGFYAGGKITGSDGKRYQVSINAVEIGSKPA